MRGPCQPVFYELVYKQLPVLDVPWERISSHFQTCIRFIKEALQSKPSNLTRIHGQKNEVDLRGKVLVQGYTGVSRSATIVIAYLMQEHRMTMFDALNFVRAKRPTAFPNQGF